MKTSELIFIGIKGSVLALSRTTGQQVWATRLKGMDFVNILFEDGSILATCCGEIFCLDAVSGRVLWHNALKGFGRGLATMATERNCGGNAAALAEMHRSDQAASAAAASAA